ncbi:MAG TPA: 4-hydroxybenzoate octaprenyltransferase [Methylophilaceae bacterium]|nr:4-hydroxybenzoate octaprenyltransferase [Methylophilaceae bacterium]HAJ71323.1 4-hydroxybenzoate octaprenyltransferase [Methylophilaceae bacterium]
MNLPTLTKKLDAYERLMRLDKPIGILLLLWPTVWALWIASRGKPDWIVLLIFITGTVLMRSAGCVMNDIADRKYDGLVERTKNRPLATGEVSVKEAYGLAIFLALLAFCLVLQFNKTTIILSFAALFLAVTYPLTKRFLAIPQAYLGIAFGFGIPMAFAAILNEIPLVAWLLLFANVFWAIAYDTEYAMVDREDDLKIGIKSSAICFGKYDVQAVLLCYALMFIILAYVGIHLGFTSYYYVGLLAAFLLVFQQYALIKKRLKTDCFKAFLKNTWIGLAILLGIVAELIVKHPF